MRFLPGARPDWLAPIGAVGVALCGIVADGVAARATQDTTLIAVLRRAGAYVSAYKRQLGSVVADEPALTDDQRRRIEFLEPDLPLRSNLLELPSL